MDPSPQYSTDCARTGCRAPEPVPPVPNRLVADRLSNPKQQMIQTTREKVMKKLCVILGTAALLAACGEEPVRTAAVTTSS